MKGWDPEGTVGPRKPLPDAVTILEPPVDKVVAEPTSEQRETAPVPAPASAHHPTYLVPSDPDPGRIHHTLGI